MIREVLFRAPTVSFNAASCQADNVILTYADWLRKGHVVVSRDSNWSTVVYTVVILMLLGSLNSHVIALRANQIIQGESGQPIKTRER